MHERALEAHDRGLTLRCRSYDPHRLAIPFLDRVMQPVDDDELQVPCQNEGARCAGATLGNRQLDDLVVLIDRVHRDQRSASRAIG